MQWNDRIPARMRAEQPRVDYLGLTLPDDECDALSDFAGRVGLAITGFFAACGVAGTTGCVLAWLSKR